MPNVRLVPCLLVILLPVLLPFAAQAEPVTAQSSPATQASQPAEKLLQRNSSMELRNAPFEKVIDQLRQMSGANIVVNWRALEQYGVNREAEVSLAPVKDLPIQKVLQLVLEQVSESSGGITEPAWTIEDNVVHISTRINLMESFSSRIYDVGDLLDMIGSPRPGSARDAGATDKLAAIITETIQPTSWASAGGLATVRSINDQFLINQTPLAHDEIVRLLQDLRKSMPQANPLWRPVSIDYQEVPLRAALGSLTREAKVEHYVNWQTLESAGIKPDTRVTVQANLAPLGTALQLTLDNASRQPQRAGYVFDQGVVIVATQDHLAQTFAAKSQQQKTKETEAQISLVDKMKETYADPIAAGVVAIGAIKAELQRSGQNIAESLEKVLGETRSQGLRNALHMTLARDLYAQAGDQEKVMDHLTRMLQENDVAYVTSRKSGVPPTTTFPTGSGSARTQ